VAVTERPGPLSGRRIVLGVSGGIAAYKAVELCRRLMDAGGEVKVIMTTDATRFVTALTFSALSGHPVGVSLWDGPDPIPHTRLGQWAEVVVIAPATARLLGAYTAGISDDLLTATLLATRAPVVVCPAMHSEMWEHPAVRDNLAVLRRRGVAVVEPGVGRLAGGDEGPGRLAALDPILTAVESAVAAGRPVQDLAGWRFLITAGGTREPIDPVRFIGNRSSGKQGYALAAVARARGASVTLVSTVAADRPAPVGVAVGVEVEVEVEVEVVRVETAEQMAAAVHSHAPSADVIIMAAAVADFRPKAAADHKLKKADGVPDLVLEPTPDILADLARTRRPGQLVVGFAAETAQRSAEQLRTHALDKLRRKHLDLIVANDVSAPGTGFGHATNAVVILTADGDSIDVALADKTAIATAVIDAVRGRLPARAAEARTDETPLNPHRSSS
jgi:phosphopantothenoylcysteine decarboxylase/phosphopantothenate--cysteine ligase